MTWVVSLLGLGQAVSQPGDSSEELAEGLRLLSGVRDGVFSFDDPGFYWFCRYARDHDARRVDEAGDSDAPISWKTLLERPSDYRGRRVLIEGVVQSFQAHDVTNRPGVPRLYQFELSNAGTSGFCTFVVTTDPGDVPIRSIVKARGYFIKVRGYRTQGGDEGAGPLVVAGRILDVRTPAANFSRSNEDRTSSWLVGSVSLMALIWFVMRRRIADSRGGRVAVQAASKVTAESDRDFDWLTNSEITSQNRDSQG